MAVVAFHGDGDRTGMIPGMDFDAREEILESLRRVRDLELLQHATVRQADGDGVATRAHVDTERSSKGVGFNMEGSSCQRDRGRHPSGLVY